MLRGFRLTLAALALCACAGAAEAELRGTPDAPRFTRWEMRVIQRNPELARRRASEPWLVRRILDLLADPSSARSGDERTMPPAAPAPSFDRRRNPDLDRLHRSSPEAALDLFRLLEAAQNL